MEWGIKAKEKYDLMLSKIPVFHRKLTKQVVDVKAPLNAQDRGAKSVEEEDIIRAFLTEVPKAFYSLMIRLMNEVGFDHDKYEEKN